MPCSEVHPNIVIKSVTWHRGGAQVDKETGEPVKWPWGDSIISPAWMTYQYVNGQTPTQLLGRMAWLRVMWYADPSDLEPPTVERSERGD